MCSNQDYSEEMQKGWEKFTYKAYFDFIVTIESRTAINLILLHFLACRYEKGSWSECVSGKMNRIDKLRTNNSEVVNAGAAAPVCEPTRNVQKNCNAGKKAERKQKDKGGRKGRN